ncbi:GNAT family N-acetyltransferase [Candidatus Gracilibacteria bacterium]|nr:GNAT family N-acetyltransferase [Candidatus Gracilibacteria bacterium]
MIKLVLPDASHKEDYLACIQEWREIENLDKISPGKFVSPDTYEELLASNTGEKINLDKGYTTPSTLFFVYSDNSELIGAIDIRHNLDNTFLKEFGGHIGYGVAPKYRRNGYATKMLEKGLEEAKKLGIEKVLVCCYDGNIASQKVIEKNGGEFERFANLDGKKLRRYWIENT